MNSIRTIGIIPARYASTRFPGKVLADIKGKSMIRRVYENALKSGILAGIWVATDDERVLEHCRMHSIPCLMTSPSHPSGTDRCLEAFMQCRTEADYILNIQGDEPALHPNQIRSLVQACTGQEEILTQYKRCTSSEEIFSESEVKIVMNKKNQALYFSRQPIPYLHKIPKEQWIMHQQHFKHVGMYMYRCDILKAICALPPSALEKLESLEQLRWLENGFSIHLVPTEYESYCVDTPSDLERILPLIQE